jgi:hypothetical protein
VVPVRKLSHSGKLGQHESKLGKVKQDWYALSMKLGDLISAVTRLSKMKRKPRLADYIDLDLLQVNLEFLHSTLAREYLLNV